MAYNPPIGDRSKEDVSNLLDSIRNPFEVAVYGSMNHFNIGGVIRSCHNFMAKKIHLVDADSQWYKKGAVTALKWEKKNIVNESLDEFLDRNSNRNIVAFEHRDGLPSKDLRSFDYPDNPIFLFGNEKFGVPEQVFKIAKDVVSIPMFGIVLDHNLCTAASSVMYDYASKCNMQKSAIATLLQNMPQGQEE